ncbi:hypothetical protein [Enterococcus mundtii]|uniref:hypothetical protein n=1 Tax=Enterococcus mundtii TaxID=53346 RepID=UPI0035C6AB98
MKKWIFWGEEIEQTQLRTVCKVAVAKQREKMRKDQRKEVNTDIFLFTACQQLHPEANQ